MSLVKKLLFAGGLCVVVVALLALAAYARFGMQGPELTSVDPTIDLRERPCEEGIRGARCGVIDVPLDYKNSDGESIETGFIYYPALGFGSGDDSAVKVIGGGPGVAVSGMLAETPMWAIRYKFRDRPILAADPRGIGLSTELECEVFDKDLETYPDLPQLGEKCAEQLGPDRVHYSTANTSRDFDLVRRALGLEQLDVTGFSYGTNLGAVYAGMFPDATRTLTLDGAYPVSTFEDFHPTYHAGMRRQFQQFCERSGDCEGDDALAALDWAAEELRENPRPLDPQDDDQRLYPENLTLDPALLASLATALPSTGVAGPESLQGGAETFHLPTIGAVLEARDEGNWSKLEDLALEKIWLPKDNFSNPAWNVGSTGLAWSVNCPESKMPWEESAGLEERRAQLSEVAEEVAPGDYAPFTAEEWANRPDTNENGNNYYNECIGWPGPPEDHQTELPEEFDDWSPDLPVLVINGDYDMNTTNEAAERAAAQFDGVRSDQVSFARFEHHGHAVIPASTCALGLWSDFVGNTSVEDPNRCLDADPKSASIESPPEN